MIQYHSHCLSVAGKRAVRISVRVCVNGVVRVCAWITYVCVSVAQSAHYVRVSLTDKYQHSVKGRIA